MSAEDQDAVVGRTFRLLKEANEHLALLKAEADRRGKRMEALGHHLAAYPEYLIKEGDSVDPRFYNRAERYPWTNPDIFPADDIQRLTTDIRETIVKIGDLSTQLRNMGHDPSRR